MNTPTYAGIGSRSTPPSVLADMTMIAAWLARCGWHLASGGATGADSAFASAAPRPQRTLYLPWRRYNGRSGSDCLVLSPTERAPCTRIAADHHPAWHRCSSGARKLHARNAAILLGSTLNRTACAVICWTPNGETRGGTGMAIRIAQTADIPVLNLATMPPRAVCETMRDIQRAL